MKKSVLIFLSLFIVLPVFGQQNDQAEEETTLIFVRHAEKSDDGTSDPSLSVEGHQRAINLAQLMMNNYDLAAIYSTQYKRTQETAKPISDSLKISVIGYQLNNPDSLINMIIDTYRGKEVLIVGHSNTTPALVNIALGERKYEQLDESDFSNVFELKIRSDGQMSVRRYTY